MSSDDLSYESALAQLAGERPRLASALHRAEKRRAQHAASLLTGARFKGMEELLRHLDTVAEAFKTNPQLSQLTFLIARSVADFETAVEATLSGYMAVAADAMRDVMEIENLLLDFAINPGHIEEWLTCDDKARMNRFMSIVVRKRLHAAGVPPFATTAESVDYTRPIVRPCTSALTNSPSRTEASPPAREWTLTPGSGRSSNTGDVSAWLCVAWPVHSNQAQPSTSSQTKVSTTSRMPGNALNRCRTSTWRSSRRRWKYKPRTEKTLDLST